MRKRRVALLFGGQSSEYAVSLMSADSVIKAIDRDRYEVIPIGITSGGDWYLYSGPEELIETDKWREERYIRPITVSLTRAERGFMVRTGPRWAYLDVDLVFPVLHGRNGEDGTVQGMLELAGLTVVGCGALSSALCMDKDRAHTIVRSAGIRTPESVVIELRDAGRAEETVSGRLRTPIFVKPLRAGSSFGVTRVAEPGKLMEALTCAFKYDSRVIVEEAVPGFEVGCAVMGIDSLICGRVDEIELSGDLFDYEEKYTLKTAKIHMPARVTPGTERRIQDAAVRIYRALDCSGFARVDMFLTPEGEIVFNEVNTIPGLTSHSRFPGMMRGAGMDFPGLISNLLGMYR